MEPTVHSRDAGCSAARCSVASGAAAAAAVNHVAAANDFPRRANESCARLFVRDERARRRGMRYCSRSYARAQAQREFRRREAASPEPAA